VNNREIKQLSDTYVMHTYNRLPIALVKGEGVKVWDADGNEYLDFIAGLAVNGLGHAHPAIIEAIKSQAGKLLHCSNIYYIEPQARLAEWFARHSHFNRTFFCNSGAEANEAAIKLARRYQQRALDNGRFEIITALNSFHGRTLTTVTATGQPKYQQGFEPLVPGFKYVELNDIAAMEDAIGPATAAVILEPIQGEGGVYPCEPGYLQAVRDLCNDQGVLLIFDEVQTGMGRTGKLFAYMHSDVEPDIITLAKSLAGGIPIGAMLATEEVAAGFEPGAHASTFGGNPFACSVAQAVVDTLEKENLISHAGEMGDYIVAGLKQLQSRYPDRIVELRGRGLMIGVQLADQTGGDIATWCMQNGLLINSIGGRILRLLPPLIVSRSDVDEMLAILAEAFAAVAG